MNYLENWTSKNVEHMKKEVAEHYAKDNNLMPSEFEKFFVTTNFNDIEMLKNAVISISKEIGCMSNLVRDICFSIEMSYQLAYDLDKKIISKDK